MEIQGKDGITKIHAPPYLCDQGESSPHWIRRRNPRPLVAMVLFGEVKSRMVLHSRARTFTRASCSELTSYRQIVICNV